MRRIFYVILGLSVVGVLAFLGVVRLHGFPLDLMDLDENGRVSPREMVRSLDLGERPVAQVANPCREIYQLKDGLLVKIVCED